MTFVEDEYYLDRDNTQYIYVERRGGVTIFLNLTTRERAIRNSVGRFRWDNQDTPVDIVGKLDE
jgi:hypothetical protein